MPGAPRWWRREADENLLAAREGKARAAMTLLELDQVQRDVEGQVTAYADFDQREGPRLAASWAPLRDAAFTATGDYLQVEQHFDLDTDLAGEPARTAAAEFERVGRAMSEVAQRVAAFGEASAGRFAQVRAARARHEALLRDLGPILARARQAIGDARAAGLRTLDPDAELATAEADAARARRTDTGTGLREATEAARAGTEHARAAIELAGALGDRRREVMRRISSARTRLQITADRVSTIDEAVSALRRRYAAGASADLSNVGGRVEEFLHTAERGIFDARNGAADSEQRWGDAEEAVRRARAACDGAEDAAAAVRRRLAELDAVAEDPQAPLEKTRRTLRDAQRYLLDSAPTLDRRLAGVLDRLAARLDAAQRELRARRPDVRVDHWAYLHELDEIAAAAGAVVTEVRERRRPA